MKPIIQFNIRKAVEFISDESLASKLVSSVSLPKSVQIIGEKAFAISLI